MSEPSRVVVLMGGRSAEREISLTTGAQVSDALLEAGFEVDRLDTGMDDAVSAIESCDADVAFICLHGRWGEDGTVQGLLELVGMPYVGSGVLASALAMDKAMCKVVYEAAGLMTPGYALLRRDEDVDIDGVLDSVGEHVVVKPASEGSAIGVTIVHDRSGLAPAIAEAFEHDALALVERFVAGTELTVGVLGNDELVAFPTLEIVPEHEFYDYESKYVPGMSRHIIPARVSESQRHECTELALGAHRALGCRGMSRSDMIVAEDATIHLLETNTIPGMTPTSLYPEAAAAMGIGFPELVSRLVALAVEDGAR